MTEREPVPASASVERAEPVPEGGGAGEVAGRGELAAGDADDALVLARLTHVLAVFVGE